MPDAMSEAIVADVFRAPEDDRPHLTTKNLLTGSLIGLFAGFASGYVGVGGGFIMVPLFVSVLGITMKHASGTSLIAVTILAVPGVIEQGLLGNIDYIAGIAMAAGSIPGSLNWRLSHSLYSGTKVTFCIWLLPPAFCDCSCNQ